MPKFIIPHDFRPGFPESAHGGVAAVQVQGQQIKLRSRSG
jgi:hypothetical protein